MFTEKGQRFDLVNESKENLADEKKYIERVRKDGGFMSSIVDADKMSIACGSSAIFPMFKNGGIKYKVLAPSDVRFYWPEMIIDNGKERAPDFGVLEDCYAVAIRLSQIDTINYSFLAIFARSTEFPNGRWVEYVSEKSCTELPKVGDKETIEYMINGEVANPLSYYINQMGEDEDHNVPEYPLCTIVGMVADDSTPMPTSTSLYEDDIEFCLAASHMLSKANSAAGGLTVVNLDDQGTSAPLPTTLDGATTALAGQEIVHISKNASDVVSANEVTKDLQVSAAFGWSVPDYMVTSEDHALEAASGIALQIKTGPLIKARNQREDRNASSVQKIFDIEKALLVLHDGSDDAAQLAQCSMYWTAGKLDIPENKKEKSERVISLYDKGLYDIIAALKELHGFSTDAEAIAEYEKMKARKQEFPPLNEEPKKAPGLFKQNG